MTKQQKSRDAHSNMHISHRLYEWNKHDENVHTVQFIEVLQWKTLG